MYCSKLPLVTNGSQHLQVYKRELNTRSVNEKKKRKKQQKKLTTETVRKIDAPQEFRLSEFTEL